MFSVVPPTGGVNPAEAILSLGNLPLGDGSGAACAKKFLFFISLLCLNAAMARNGDIVRGWHPSLFLSSFNSFMKGSMGSFPTPYGLSGSISGIGSSGLIGS